MPADVFWQFVAKSRAFLSAHEIAFADLKAVVTQDVVCRHDMKIEIW
jgi:hypothetical protein